MTTAGYRSTRSLALLLSAIALSAHAGQPLFTDDATVVAPRTCQLEAWIGSDHESRQYWAQPACNFTGNLELAVGGARAVPHSGATSSLLQLQAKTVLFSADDDAWSFGMVAGAGRDTGTPHGGSAFQLYSAKALASLHPTGDLEIDLNLGAANVYGTGTFAVAAAAVQYTIGHVQLLGEVYRGEPGHASYQVGARYIVVPDRFEAYASYGNRFNGSSDQWFAIFGIRLQTPAFLP